VCAEPVLVPPQRTELVAMDEVAERAGVDAGLKDRVPRDGPGDVLDLDVEPVCGERQAGDESRLEDHTGGQRVGAFRVQVRVAATLSVVLLRRARRAVAGLRRRDSTGGA